MPELKKCRACGVEIRSNAPFGHCPQCLIALGFGPVPEKPAEAPKNTSVQHSFGTVRYFGDYELLEEIARGGMGTVFRARQTSLNRLVALKLISAGALATEELVKRFKAEAESAASLTHPNIVPIHEIGQHEGQHYFSMGLIEGGSLAEKLRKLHRPHPKPGSRQGDEADGTVARTGPPPHVGGYAPLSLRDSAQLLITIARAVHYAHQRGVLHRDLKPGNILLDDKGQPHLTDFGLAKLIEKESALTHTNAVMGTPAYMSPEQARGESKDVTTATDVYGLGAVFYETLTGSPPFGGGTSMETIRQVIDQEPRRPSILNPKVDRDLETICLKCLEKEPQRRYTSAEAFADDLERWLRDEPILARRATLFERATKWARRQPVLAAAVVLLHVVLLLGIGGVFWQWRRADHASRETSQSNDQLRRALDQMDYIQLQRAEEYFAEDRRADALPRWALVLRNNPSNRLAAERLMSTLSHRNWARLACPPLEHSNRVTFALFSRDGTKVVTSSADNTAWVWDAVTGRRLAGPFTHGAEINTAMLSEDGRFVVTASKDKTARVWNALTGAFVTEPLQHSGDVSMAGFSTDGEKVFTVCGDTGQLWSVNNGQRMGDAIRGAGSITDVRLSPDGSRLAMACIGRRAQLWDVASGACLHHLQHANDILSVAFSPDGKQLVTASYDNTARVWDVQTGEPASEPLRHQARVWLAEFSPDGQRIVTASGDHTAQIWDARTGKKIGPPMKHDGEVRCALFSPEGTRVVTASWDKTVRVWDALTGESLTEPLAHDDRMFFAGFFPDGERILTAGNGNVVHIWNVAALKGSALTSPHVYPYMTEFSPDGKTIIVRSHTGHSQLLDPFTLAKKGELRPHESGAHRFDFSPDGKPAPARR